MMLCDQIGACPPRPPRGELVARSCYNMILRCENAPFSPAYSKSPCGSPQLQPSPLRNTIVSLIRTSDLLPSCDEAPLRDDPFFPLARTLFELGDNGYCTAFPSNRQFYAGLLEFLLIGFDDLNFVRFILFADIHVLWAGHFNILALFALPESLCCSRPNKPS
jgi:hypothetical protein